MNDIVIVGIIAGGSALLGVALTGTITYIVSVRTNKLVQ